ncbi:DUF6804 family protein [Mesoflavibacter zeaxanthinifaciens]|jgi:uncharacterized membrane protein|uniref:DUF6804 family protein n=1 Tax=Mesoflavibacter zeaxanthinifaciens TaxID=393060 RepID=UPI003A8EF383
MNKVIKVALSLLFFLCLADMPYGYYQLVRFLAFIGFGYLAYQAKQENNNTTIIIYAALALLFQPFFKIALGRELWNIVDVLVAIGLIISIFKKKKTTMEKPNSRK